MHRIGWRFFLGLLLWCGMPSWAGAKLSPVTVEQIRHGWPTPKVERWVLDTQHPLPVYRVALQSERDLRLIFSLPLRFSRAPKPTGALASMTLSSDGTVLHLKLRRGQWGKRFVLGPSASHGFHRFVIDIRHDTGRLQDHDPQRDAVALSTKKGSETLERRKTLAPKASAIRTVVVIDPGHGGKDPGTMASGLVEKDVALRYGLSLEKILASRYTVRLTRRDDRFLSLAERVRLAREAKADLFVSLHVDSHPDPHIRGLSVHSLGAKASDEATAMLVASENGALEDDLGIASDDPLVRDILVDLLRRETDNLSAYFAEGVVASWRARGLALLPKPYRRGNFRILKAVDIPGVIVELGFASHAVDAKQLLDPSYERKVVEALAAAIDGYTKSQMKSSPPPLTPSPTHDRPLLDDRTHRP